MESAQLSGMLRFDAQFPAIYLRNHEGGRVKVLARNGDWLATVCPHKAGCFLLFKDSAESEFRGSYGHIAYLLSVYQQSGGNIGAVCDADEIETWYAE